MATGDLSCPLQRAATQLGDAPAVLGLTYATLDRRVGALAAALGDLGTRFGYLGANLPGHLEAWLAVPAFGGVLVDLNYRLAGEELALRLTTPGVRSAARAAGARPYEPSPAEALVVPQDRRSARSLWRACSGAGRARARE